MTTKWTIDPATNQATAARYVAMWHQVWKIFQAEGATNVLWTWSPNFQTLPKAGQPNKLSAELSGQQVRRLGRPRRLLLQPRRR